MSSSLSFKFTKNSRPKLSVDESVRGADEDNTSSNKSTKRQKVTSLDATGFSGSIDERSHKIVIPALKNTLKFGAKSSHGSDLDILAKKALLDDARRLEGGKTENSGSGRSDRTSDVILNSSNVSYPAEAAQQTDYDSIPVDCFGTALLRGLGWQEGQPIGRTAKRAVKPWITEPRPKGLGLGAAISKPREADRANDSPKGAGDSGFKKGAHVKISKAQKAQNYGTIVSVDEDNARLFVKLANGDQILNPSQYAVSLITKNEYQKAVSGDKQTSERDDSGEYAAEMPKIEFKTNSESWLRTDLKIRVIDDKVYDGKYFKQKVVVADIITPDTCNCVAENGKLLENLHFTQLETVIPKISTDGERRNQPSPNVMILYGEHKGEIGSLIERDSKRNEAVVRIVAGESEGEVVLAHFDDICEYVGRYA